MERTTLHNSESAEGVFSTFASFKLFTQAAALIQYQAPIIALAYFMGLDRDRKHLAVIESGNLEDCFSLLPEDAAAQEWYLSGDGLCCEALHGNGLVFYCFRVAKDTINTDTMKKAFRKHAAGLRTPLQALEFIKPHTTDRITADIQTLTALIS